jgi:predicted dehydrogenase
VGGITNYDTDDAVSALVRFKNGTLATVTSGAFADADESYDSHITFRSGKMTATLFPGDVFEVEGESEEEDVLNLSTADDEAGYDCDRAFIEAILENDPSRVRSDYADGVKTLTFADAIRRSVNEGRAVKVGI